MKCYYVLFLQEVISDLAGDIALVFPKDRDLFPQIQMTLIYEVAKSHMDLVGRPTDLYKS